MRILASILLLFCFLRSDAQKADFIYNKLTTNNGLASNYIFSEYQDDEGFIWVGTANGLQRFDGKRFYDCRDLNIQDLNAEPVKQIISDGAGTVWMKVGEQFGKFNPHSFHFTRIKIKEPTEYNHDSKLFADGNGNIFIIFRGNILLKYDQRVNEFTDDLPFKIPDGWKITSIFFDKKFKNYWLTGDKGILIFNINEKRYLSPGDLNSGFPKLDMKRFTNVLKVYIDMERRVWILYWPNPLKGQMFDCFSEKEQQFFAKNIQIRAAINGYHVIENLFETDKGDLWLYGSNVLAYYNRANNSFQCINKTNNPTNIINYDQVTQMIEDKEHNVWVATDAGWYSCSPERPLVRNFYFDKYNGLNFLNDVVEFKDNYYLASWNYGIVKMDENFKTDSTSIFKSSNRDMLLSWNICVSHKKNLLFSGHQHGWLRVDIPNVKKPAFYQFPVFNGKTIRDIAEDKNQNLWFVTQEGKLITYDPAEELSNGHFREIRKLGIIVNRLFVDRSNKLWICSFKGLYCMDPLTKKILKYYNADGDKEKTLSDYNVTDIAQINDSTYAIAANNFNILNTNTDVITRYTYFNGVSSNKINCLIADDQSNIWITSSNGICRFNFSSKNFTRYSEKDGFQFSESFGERSRKLEDGSIVTVGGSQLVVFNPKDFNQSVVPPTPTITDIKIFEQFLNADSLSKIKNVRFQSDKNSISFYFSSMSFFLEDKLNFYFRLKGVEKNWQLSDNSKFVNYSGLPPGDYTFQVVCKNEQGLTSAVRNFQFSISSPFYSSWWFVSLVFLFVLFNIMVIYTIQENKRRAVENMRSRVARDLHDDMGSTLSTINILSVMAKNRLATDSDKTEQYINKISDNSNRMMEAMDDIVWSIKPANDSMQKIASRMREFSTSVLEAKNIDIDFKVDEGVNDVKLNMTGRRDFFLLFKEAINNLAKYSQATKASIHLRLANKRLILEIRDNGVGFDVEQVDSGNGLANMKKRADLLKARFEIESKIGVGTIVSLNLAAG